MKSVQFVVSVGSWPRVDGDMTLGLIGVGRVGSANESVACLRGKPSGYK